MKLKKAKSVYFKSKALPKSAIEINGSIQKWQPNIFSLVPPEKPLKYLILSLLSLFGLINSKYFFQRQLVIDNVIASSFLSVPKIYKWPYMSGNDVQIMYVKTHPDYRGNGLASKLIKFSLMNDYKEIDGYIWYVTDKNNIASIKTAESIGFETVNNV